jgi:putative ABC transport system permease protein
MLTDLVHRVRAVFRRASLERELDDELRFHIERQIQTYVQRGLTPEQAARRARLDFGGIDQVKEQCRDARGVGPLEEVSRNLRYAARTLAKRPAFTTVAVLTLALGIGANSAVFSAVHTIVLRPLPFRDGDRLMRIEQFEPKALELPRFVAPLRLEDWQGMNSTFQAITGYFADDISETSGELPERLACAWVTPRFFHVWGIVPGIGRGFTEEEQRFGGPHAVVVSDRLWKRRFGAAQEVGARRLRIGQQSYPIVGVMPASFMFPIRDVDVWMPSPVGAPYARDRKSTWYTVVGRLRPGVTMDRAEADLNSVQRQLAAQYPETDAHLAVRVRSLKEVTIGDVGRSLWMLFAAVSVLLLIACTNIAALLLARGADRQQEISIRYSLGASRAAIVRQLLTEGLVLALLGSALGLGVAAGAFRMFHVLAGTLPRVAELRLNWTLVVYSLTCAAGATLLFGLVPALRGTRRQTSDMRSPRSRTVAPATSQLQWLLVGMQVALAVTLLVGAGLLLRSFDALGRVSAGFEPARVLTFRITGNYGETANLEALYRRIDSTLDSLRAVPGIEAAATALAIPGVPFQYQTELRFSGEESSHGSRIMASTRVVSAGYFTTVRIPLLTGESCYPTSTVPLALVNRRFAALYHPGRTLVGRYVEHVPPNPFLKAARIIGVVGDAREEGLNQEPGPIVYWCNNAPVPAPLFLVRTRVEPMAMAETIRRKVHELEPRRSVYEMMPLEARLDESFAENRLRTTLLTFFAGTAVSLAAIGLYGTLSYLVSMRRREIGVRMAMGARPGEIALSFLRQGLRVSLAGCLAGVWLAAAVGRGLSGMLYRVTPLDGQTYVGVVLLMGIIAVLSSVWPAIRAARTEPVRVLREE